MIDEDEETCNWDWFAWIFITLIIGIGIGYYWGWYHGEMKFEQGYEAAAEELSVVVKGEVCK